MARKKTAKRTAKRQSSRNTFATIQKMEKDFLKVPAKLSSQISKQISSLKRKEIKLRQAVGKLDTHIKTIERKFEDAVANRITANGRKKYIKLKKAHSDFTKQHAGLNKALSNTSKSLENYNKQQDRTTALRKYLNQFDKEWLKQSKVSKTKTKAKTKEIDNRSALPLEQQNYNEFETIEDINIREDAEVTS